MIPISKDRLILIQTVDDKCRLLALGVFEMSAPSCTLRDAISIDGIRYIVLGSGEPGDAIDIAAIGELKKSDRLPSHFWPRGVTLKADDQRAILDALIQ